jgi:sorbitol-specific phosphotransferase system component IIC
MTIIIPVLVGILTLLTIIKCMVGQAKRRRDVERELARIEARDRGEEKVHFAVSLAF